MGFFDKGIKVISNEELGRRVKESHLKYLQRVEENTPLWIKEGAQMRARRESQKISQAEVSELVGVCTQTLVRLECGKPVKRRDMMKKSYETAMNFILLRRKMDLKKYGS